MSASERVDRLRDAGFLRDDLLRSQGDPDRLLGRQPERFVECVGVERLSAAEYSGERLDRRADDVVPRLLRRERRAHRLSVEAEGKRRRRLRTVALAHDVRPHTAGGTKFRDLLEERRVRREKERELRREAIDVEPALHRSVDVRDRVGKSERELLDGVRTGLADVIAADRDRIPARVALRAVRDEIGGEPHRRARREDVRPACDVLLEDVVLRRAADPLGGYALPLRDGGVHREEDRRGRVDRHRGRHVADGYALEEKGEVLEGADRHADLPDLAGDARIVRVVAHLRR